MESVVAWIDCEIEPCGIDFAPGLVDLARVRLPHWADRIWVGDAANWMPPFRFDFGHTRGWSWARSSTYASSDDV
jgi:hypothetical protein